MKDQTYITKLYNKDNKRLDFQRWSYKRLETVEQKIIYLYSKLYADWMIREFKENNADEIRIYKTDPSGDHQALRKIIKFKDLRL